MELYLISKAILVIFQWQVIQETLHVRYKCKFKMTLLAFLLSKITFKHSSYTYMSVQWISVEAKTLIWIYKVKQYKHNVVKRLWQLCVSLRSAKMMDSMCSTASPRVNQISYTHYNKKDGFTGLWRSYNAPNASVYQCQSGRAPEADDEDKLLNHQIL